MTGRLYIFLVMILSSLTVTVFAQQKAKSDIYLYFKPDSLNGFYKTTIRIKGEVRKKSVIPDQDYDIYHYSYSSVEKKKKYHFMLFSTINKMDYCIRDTSLFSSHKILPYKNLEKIKGLFSDDWNSKTFPFKRVFLVEKIAANKFKTVQVTIYYPFNSNGVEIESIK
jgi:hypothetical protein